MDMNLVTEGAISIPTRNTDGYEQLLSSVRNKFTSMVNDENKVPLFTTTTTTNLYQLILDAIPEEARQHYNCNTCRGFVNRYGGLVTIDPDTGAQTPVMWDPDTTPEFFRQAIGTIMQAVKHAQVSGVFVTTHDELGRAQTGPWNHMAVTTPAHLMHKPTSWSPITGVQAEYSVSRKLLHQALAKYPIDVIGAVLNLLKSGQIAGGSVVVNNAEWFYETAKKYKTPGLNLHNWVWYMAATAPKGWCHINSNLFGTILEDVMAGADIETVKRKYEAKAAPDKYQRPTAAPTSGAIAEAEKRFAELGLENSLRRRYATLSEVQKIWTPTVLQPAEEKKPGIFSDITPKDKKPKPQIFNTAGLPPVLVTWEKFKSTVLDAGLAKSITFTINGGQKYPFAAILTAADISAPPIILWDKPEERNPFSWYTYNCGSAASAWNIDVHGYSASVDVVAIVETPNLWSNFMRNPNDKGVIFILDGCKDRYAERGDSQLGLFATNVRKDLYDVRSVIEAYSTTHTAEGIDVASACGILMQPGLGHTSMFMRVCVTSDIGRTEYVIDRWD